MELWHEMKISSQGEMMTNSEKFKLVAEKLNVYCAANGWSAVTPGQVRNKIDALVAKKKKIYENFKARTSTGQSIDNQWNLEVSSFVYLFISRPRGFFSAWYAWCVRLVRVPMVVPIVTTRMALRLRQDETASRREWEHPRAET